MDHSHGARTNGGVYDFVRPVDDYAVRDITRLWYAWANYHVKHNDLKHETATATYKANLPNGPANEITLTSALKGPLGPGMTVTGPGIRPGTTILSVANRDGDPIGEANKAGDRIYLSLIPSDTTPGSRFYTFDKPVKLPFTDEEEPYDLKFAAAGEKKALRFAGSVYAAMSAEAPVLQPSKLPKSAVLVGQVIQFYANLPTDSLPGGKHPTGQVRDVVKSILRGVWNFVAVPDQDKWYPDPAEKTAENKDFNVYNLDPYVWFVHKNEWFPTIPWGKITTTATISKVGGDGKYKNI